MVPLYLLVVFNVVFNGYRLCGKLALFLFVWLRFFFLALQILNCSSIYRT